MRRSLFLLPLLLFSLVPGIAAAEPPSYTQRDWMVSLVNGLGWSFGLPDEPEDADYLRILEGGRVLRIEAEEVVGRDDMVSVKDHAIFGPFSGPGWLSGIATPTTAHLRFLLPLSGRYRVTAALRLPGHRVTVGEATLEGDGAEQLREVSLGELDLTAGELTLVAGLPANGGIDFVELSAVALPAVEPLGGWVPEAPLSRSDLAVTAARVLGLESLLPAAGKPLVLEAESSRSLDGAEVTQVRHLGEPSGGAWVRAGNRPARLGLDFNLPKAGVYTLRVRAEGDAPLTLLLNDRDHLTGDFPPYLKTLGLGAHYLTPPRARLLFELSPRAGVDRVELLPHRSSPEDYRRLVGLPSGDAPLSGEELDRFLALLAAIGAPR